MKFEVTNPKAWKAVNEKNIPMSHKIKVYEKLGGAYRLGENGGEQVFNKMTELLKHRMAEGDDNSSPEETLTGLKEMAMGNLERIADYSNMILQRMQGGQELDSWMYSQLTISLENLNSVHDAMDGDDGKIEPLKEEPAKSSGEKIQNLNNRIKVLRDKISATKSPEQKKLHSDRLKNALQSLSNIKKDHSIKEQFSIKDGKYRFYVEDEVGYLEYNGKVISMGDFDRGAGCFWMTHDDFKGQKPLDTPKDVIAFFKKNKIVK